MMKRIAILIPVFNNLEFTKKCVKSLRDQFSKTEFKNISLSIVITDDGSKDGTSEWLASNHPDIKVLKGDGNLWWSGGINMGARYVVENSLADYVFLWNNDIKTDEDYFSELDRLMPDIEDDVIVGSKIYYLSKPEVIWSYGGIFNTRTGKRYMKGYEQVDGPEFSEPQEVDWLPGMGTLVPVSIIQQIGYWDDKNFPQYHGDSDYTCRAKRYGFILRVYPGLKMWNDKSSSGLTHNNTIRGLIRMLFDTRSNLHLRKNFLFYKRHATSFLAYFDLIKSYLYLLGGFFKWKILGIFGVRRKSN